MQGESVPVRASQRTGLEETSRGSILPIELRGPAMRSRRAADCRRRRGGISRGLSTHSQPLFMPTVESERSSRLRE